MVLNRTFLLFFMALTLAGSAEGGFFATLKEKVTTRYQVWCQSLHTTRNNLKTSVLTYWYRLAIQRPFFTPVQKTVSSSTKNLSPQSTPTEQKNTVIITDFDGIVGNRSFDQSAVTQLIACQYPTSLWCVYKNKKNIEERLNHLAMEQPSLSDEKRTENIITLLRDECNCDFTSIQNSLIALAQERKPFNEMIAILRKAKAEGHTVIAATHFSQQQYQRYCTSFKEQGVDIEPLFDRVILVEGEQAPYCTKQACTFPKNTFKDGDDYFKLIQQECGSQSSLVYLSNTNQFLNNAQKTGAQSVSVGFVDPTQANADAQKKIIAQQLQKDLQKYGILKA